MLRFVIMILLVLGGSNVYIAWRVWQGARWVWPCLPFKAAAGAAVLMMVLMAAGFMRSRLPLGEGVKHALGTFSAWWMGAFVYLLLFCVLADGVILLAKIVRLLPWNEQPAVRLVSSALVIVLTAGTVLYGVHHADRLKHVAYDVHLTGRDAASEMNIIMISDVHLGAERSERRLENIVKEINEASPDLILIAGDFFDSDYGAIRDPEKAAELLGSLKSSFGIYACLGNHDAGATFDDMVRFLEQSGIRLLADETVVIDGRINLAGRLDGSPIGGYGGQRRKALEQILPSPNGLPTIVLDHNPAYVDSYGREADLVLCGHTHQGQIFPGNLITNRMYTVDHGYYRRDENSPHVIVTSGVGAWGPPMRVGTDCEINHIRLSW